MLIRWFLILYGLKVVRASLSPIYYQDPSECVQKLLTVISKTKSDIADVSLLNNRDVVVRASHGINGLRFVTREESWVNEDIYSSAYVFNFEDYNDMNNALNNVTTRDRYWNPFSNIVIILEQLDANLDEIANILVHFNVYNVSILKKEIDDYSMYTFKSPVHPCREQHLIKVAYCSKYNGGSITIPTLLEDHLHGCKLKFGGHKLYPMVMLNKHKPGLEEQMLQIFSKRHHMTIEIAEYREDLESGFVRGRNSKAQLLFLVYFLNLDGVVGGYHLNNKYLGKYFYSYPVFVDHLVWVLQRARVYDTWHAIFSRNKFVFLVILLLIIMFSALAYLLGLFPSRKKDAIRDLLIVFGFFLNRITVRNLKHGLSQSIIGCTLLFSVFIIPYSIQAFLCSVQTHPVRGFEPKTYEDINKEKFNLILPYDWSLLNFIPHNSKNECTNRMECLQKVMHPDREHYTLMSSGLFTFDKLSLVDDSCTSNVYAIQEPASTMLRTVYFRSGSFLVKPYNDFIMKYVSHGLFQKHYIDLLYDKILACKYRARPIHISLTLTDFYQPFTILIWGYSLSILSFVCEFLVKRLNLRFK